MAQQSRLLTIIPEIRNRIYEFTIDLEIACGLHNRIPHRRNLPSITRVCKQARAETVPMALYQIPIHVDGFVYDLDSNEDCHLIQRSPSLLHWLSGIMPGALRFMGRVQFDFELSIGSDPLGNRYASFNVEIDFTTKHVKMFSVEKWDGTVLGFDGLKVDAVLVAAIREVELQGEGATLLTFFDAVEAELRSERINMGGGGQTATGGAGGDGV